MPKGGKREGAGRKSLPTNQQRRKINARISPEVADKLDAYLSEVTDRSLTSTLETALTMFLRWQNMEGEEYHIIENLLKPA